MTAPAAEHSVRIGAVIGNVNSTSNVTRNVAAIPVLSLTQNSPPQIASSAASEEHQLASFSLPRVATLIVNLYVTHCAVGLAVVTAVAQAKRWSV